MPKKITPGIDNNYYNVVLLKKSNTYAARIRVNDTVIQFGTFTTAESAAKVVDVIMLHEWNNASEANMAKIKFNFAPESYDAQTINAYQIYLDTYLAKKERIKKSSTITPIASKIFKQRDTSKFKGVYLTPTGQYKAQFTLKGMTAYLGTFPNEIEAAQAYDVVMLYIWNSTSEEIKDLIEFNFKRESYDQATQDKYQSSINKYLAKKSDLETIYEHAKIPDGNVGHNLTSKHDSNLSDVYQRANQYVAQINIDDKITYLGTYPDPEAVKRVCDVVMLGIWNVATAAEKSILEHKFNYQRESYDDETIAKYRAMITKNLSKSSIYNGVYLSRNGYYRAQITINGNKLNLGSFRDEVLAAKAVDDGLLDAWENADEQLKEQIEKKLNFSHKAYLSARPTTETPLNIKDELEVGAELLSIDKDYITSEELPQDTYESLPLFAISTPTIPSRYDDDYFRPDSPSIIFRKQPSPKFNWISPEELDKEYLLDPTDENITKKTRFQPR